MRSPMEGKCDRLLISTSDHDHPHLILHTVKIERLELCDRISYTPFSPYYLRYDFRIESLLLLRQYLLVQDCGNNYPVKKG